MKRFEFSAQTSALKFPFCGHSAEFRWHEEKESAVLTIALPYGAAYGMLVEDYLREWLEQHKPNISSSTYVNYKRMIDGRVTTFFKPMG